MALPLPVELFIHAFQFCSRLDLRALARTCRAFCVALQGGLVPQYRLIEAMNTGRCTLWSLLSTEGQPICEDACTACFFAAPRRLVACQLLKTCELLQAVLPCRQSTCRRTFAAGWPAEGGRGVAQQLQLELWHDQHDYCFVDTDRDGEGPIWYHSRCSKGTEVQTEGWRHVIVLCRGKG